MPLFRPTPYLLAGRPKTAPHEIPPTSSSLPAPRSADQADKYFRRVANENVKPGRGMRLLSVGGWVVGGVACTYMVLFADFGDKEHVFSPVRRQFRSYTSSLFNLSESERSMMSLPFEDPVRKSGSVRTIGTTAESIIKNNNNNQNDPVTGTGDVDVDAIGKTGLLDKHGKGIAGPMNGESTIRGRFV